ncbi:protein translocase subunit SecD [candidate division KSB1 bacterium]|nr:protein translocase subunit SecD [candidate division KSB1 bacterium]
MQRRQLFKVILVAGLVLFSLYALYPTVQLGGLQDQETRLIQEISEFSGLDASTIMAGITQGSLESLVRQTTSGDSQSVALDRSAELIRLSRKIESVENKAIRRGLDLQGGTYLVYEVDLPQLMNDLGKNKDDRFEDIIKATQEQVEKEGLDFFDAFTKNFADRNIRLNRYFGRKGQADDDILADLQNESADAIDRTVQVLRNRVDEFGVSEPSITKQGSRRIIIELAGITNIQRAKDVIGTTALLEFKLVKEADLIWSVLNDIDRVVKTELRGQEAAAQVQTDTTQFSEGGESADAEVKLEDLFGGGATQESSADTALLVDQNTFSEKPFTALLRATGGRFADVISVPTQNAAAVQRWLLTPRVLEVIPADAQFLWGKDVYTYGDISYRPLYLVKKEPELTGALLKNASVSIASGESNLSAGSAEVHMELNNEGSKLFAKTTGMNVGKKLAIVLDGRVASAPNIKEKIPSGSARIDNIGAMEEAQDLALVLRAGALPAPVHIITENTVGPSLGQDSIRKGSNSALIGLALVILFMILYYRLPGVVADLALVLNILFVLAIMASFHATLTLPGIAGIILTVGMAVDANVLIFERIREERRTGKTPRAYIDTGYGRAFRTILDANITTLITAIVLYSFGTGPIRGFALTLSIGIIASMFTAIVVTRLIFELLPNKMNLDKVFNY